MARRALPALLVFAAFLSDVADSHGLALVFLFGSIPAALALALDCYGDAIEARCGRTRPILATLSVFLLVLSAALRSPAVVGGVPQLAVSALVVCLFLYAGFVVALRPAPSVARMPAKEETGQDRLAA